MGNLLIDHYEGSYPKKVYWCGSQASIKEINKTKFFRKFIDEGLLEIVLDKLVEVGEGKKVHFRATDGSTSQIEIDTLLWCSGYQQTCPFVDPQDNLVQPDGRYMGGLFKMLWSVQDPDFMMQAVHSYNLFTCQYADWQAKTMKHYILGDLKNFPNLE